MAQTPTTAPLLAREAPLLLAWASWLALLASEVREADIEDPPQLLPKHAWRERAPEIAQRQLRFLDWFEFPQAELLQAPSETLAAAF